MFPGRHGVGQAAGASVAFSGFRGAALNHGSLAAANRGVAEYELSE